MKGFLGTSVSASFFFSLALRFLSFGFSAIDLLDLSLSVFDWFGLSKGLRLLAS
jgi:hypothetical protein